jgi:ribulose-5-phosphate 4-epimerase/fuculose-1-phosphate aldolase
MRTQEPRTLLVELCRHMYGLGSASGTGGGISLRDGDRVYMAPSGVQKERLQEADLFVLDLDGNDLIIVPKGRYHRFELTESKTIVAVRLFQNPSGWVPQYR